MKELPTPRHIARAWHSVKDEWIVRRNKARDSRQWEVVHNWGRDVIDDATMNVITSFATEDEANRRATLLENQARGAAVLKLFNGKRS